MATQIFLHLRTTCILLGHTQLYQPSEVLIMFRMFHPHASTHTLNIPSCTHASTAIIRIFDAISTHTTKHSQNLHRTTNNYSFTFPPLQVYHSMSSNIHPAWSTLYSEYLVLFTHTPQTIYRIFKNLRTLAHSLPQCSKHIGTHLWIFLLRKIMHRHILQHSSTPINPASSFAPFKD